MRGGTRTTPIRLASSEEAQLIVAEAELASGNVGAAVGIINQLHARVGLPAFSSQDAEQVKQQLIAERRAELFFEGQHLADYRRLELPFVPAPGSSYYGVPAVTYGSSRCFPLPVSERANNPNIP